MKHLLVMMVIMLSSGVRAEKFSATIHSVDFGERGEPHLVRFDNSRVSFIDSNEPGLLNSFLAMSEERSIVEVNIDKDNNIVSAESKRLVTDPPEDAPEPQPAPFSPTIVKGPQSAMAIFKKMRRDYTKGGECFNRAHIWAYEDHKKTGRNLMKVYMFFTDRYIRKYKYHWWFHVSPMVYQGNLSSPRILDRRYTSGPRTTKSWSDIFIKSKRTCKKVATFNEYFENQKTADCYHIHTSMYYTVPRDIEKRDLTGKDKAEFNEKEIRRAYQNAFKKNGARF